MTAVEADKIMNKQYRQKICINFAFSKLSSL